MEVSKTTEREIAPATRAPTFALNWGLGQIGLGAVLVLAAVLRLVGLDKNGFSNIYYAAAVKSMLTSWHNFFFVSFDTAGFISVDKPPLGLWIQTASAKLFGFSGLSILLPQALAGVGAVALVYYPVRRVFNPVAGLIAALVLTLTPVTVAVDRNNTIDSILVLFLVLAAWAFLRAAETGRWTWLALGGVLVGLGFNVKMIEAFMVLPAFYLVYLLGAQPRGWLKRTLQLAVVSLIIVIVSFSWATIVDLTPASQRPYVGSSSTNSVYNLIFDYNGVGRQTGSLGGVPGGAAGSGPPQAFLEELPPAIREEFENATGGGASLFESEPGALRLLKQDLAGQVSWLLPLVLLGAVALAWREKWHLPLNRRQQSLILWGGWLVTCGLVFSFDSGIFHSYYLIMLGPPIAALSGAGLTALWEDWQGKKGPGLSWLLPLAVALTGLYAAYIAASDPDWQSWLVPLVIALTVITVTGLVGLRWFGLVTPAKKKLSLAVLGLTLVVMLTGPTAWALSPVLAEGNGSLPEANPRLLKGQNSNQIFAGNYDTVKLEQYLEANRQGATYLLGTLSATQAAPVILQSGQAVMAMGGFIGADPVLTVDKLGQLVKTGQIRFFLVQSFPGPGMPGGEAGGLPLGSGSPGAAPGASGNGNSAVPGLEMPGSGMMQGTLVNQQVSSWIQNQCKVVDAAEWGGQSLGQASPDANGITLPFGGGSDQKLYDCGGVK